MSAQVRTVLGDIAPAYLGITDSHDHLFFRSPTLPGQELDDPAAALVELKAFAALGGRAVAQWTPWGLGPGLDELPDLSRQSGVHVIAATGMHRARHYDPTELTPVYDGLTELFIRELTGPGVRAGMIKISGAYHHLDEHTRHVARAAAAAHHATDSPIGIHLEAGSAALEMLELLSDTHGIRPQRIILGHLHRFPDTRIHCRAAELGAYLAFDGPSRAHHNTDWRLLDTLAALTDAGHTHRILLGGDTVTATARSTADGPGMPFLLTTLRPRIERELGPDIATAIFIDNPASAFAANWRSR